MLRLQHNEGSSLGTSLLEVCCAVGLPHASCIQGQTSAIAFNEIAIICAKDGHQSRMIESRNQNMWALSKSICMTLLAHFKIENPALHNFSIQGSHFSSSQPSHPAGRD